MAAWFDHDAVLEILAEHGGLEMLRWAVKRGCSWSDQGRACCVVRRLLELFGPGSGAIPVTGLEQFRPESGATTLRNRS
jgi:hypothetical protein